MPEKHKAFLLRWGYRAAVAALLWLALRYLLPWLLPFLPALGLAVVLEPAVERVHRITRIKRSFLAAVCTLVTALVSLLLRQAQQALDVLPEALAQLPAFGSAVLERLDRFCAACPDGLREDLEAWLGRLPRLADSAAEQISGRALRFMGSAVSALPRLSLFGAATALGTYFCLSSYPAIAGFTRRQLTEPQRRRVRGL